MDSRLTTQLGFATVTLMVLVYGLFAQKNSHDSSAVDHVKTPVAVASLKKEKTANATLFPAFIPNRLTTVGTTSRAAKRGLHMPAASSLNSAALPMDDISATRLMAAYDSYAQARQKADADLLTIVLANSFPHRHGQRSNNAQSRSQIFIDTSETTTASQPHGFHVLLQPGGFQRPAWQDMSADANLAANASDMEKFVVVIDPGHGGSDPGAKGHNGLLEKDLTLDIARRVRLSLTDFEHIEVKLTRNHDYGLSRHARLNAITRSQADMVISLHFNHLPQSDVNLVESYYAGADNILESLATQQANKKLSLHRTSAKSLHDVDLAFTEGSARLAHTLQEHVFAEISSDNEHIQNAGVKEETLFVLTRSYLPGVLMELSCLSHTPEATRLESDEYRNRLAAALVDGIRDYHDSLQRVPLRKRGDVGA